MKMFQFFWILLLISATGCSLYKSNIKEPLIELPPSYSETKGVRALPVGKWWEEFNNKKLNELMEESFRHNLDIAQFYERLQQSLAALRIADSSRGLILSFEGLGGRARQSGTSGTTTSDTYSLSAAASYEIDFWGRLKSTSKAARYDALASEEDLKALFISISAQIADLYYLAVEQRAQLELSDKTIEAFRDTLNRVERRYREGLVPAIDVYQSRQNLSSAKAKKPLFEASLTAILNAISVLTGNFPNKEIGGDVKDFTNAPNFQAGIPSQLLNRRPDIQAAFLRLKANDERIAAAIADKFPSFNLVGTYGGASDKIRTVLDSPNIFWTILLQTVQPVLDAGRRTAEVERTEAVVRENLAKYHKTVLTAFQEVEDALAQGKATEKRIKILHERTSASENELRIALNNYLQGLTDYLPVLAAQQRFYDAKSTMLTAKRQLISDRIQLARALGGEWANNVMNYYVTTER